MIVPNSTYCSHLQDSSNRLDLSQISSDQLTKLINQSAAVESNQSNRSQETGSQVSSPLTGKV